MKFNTTKHIILFLFFIVLTSCFTGIENTKKITTKDVAKAYQEQGVDSNKETQYNRLTVDSFPNWKTGREFYVTENNIKRIFTPTSAYDIDTINLAGKTLKYTGFNENSIYDNNPKVSLIFTDGTNEYIYETGKTIEDIKRKNIMLSVPFLVDMELINKYRKELNGKDFFIRSSIWYNKHGEMIPGKKFIKVKIIDVIPGDKVFPLSIKFITEYNDYAYVFISTKQSSVQNRLFDYMFSEKDIRLNYPTISDINWNHIINGDITTDMTKDECRLSLGTPSNVQERPTQDGLQEYWFYSDGMYLIFFDGLLRQYRK